MKRLLPLLLLAAGCQGGAAPAPDGDAAKRIFDAVMAGNDAHKKLVELCDDVGHRLSGSTGLDRAIEWGVRTLEADGQENVRREPVSVPKWVRGNESLAMVEPLERRMPLLGLGGSIATPKEGITAEVVVARDRNELGDAAGKIVVWNRAFTTYGETVAYRVNGASWAAEKGAVAALVRSITPRSLQTPHTGGMRYAPNVPKIPTAAITIEDAEYLERLVKRGRKAVLRLVMEAHDAGEAPSANVVGELRGREFPDEIVLVSGHLDTWDVGQGAHDDGGGCVIAMETLNVLRKLGLRPRRTIRCVLWTNEENGMAGVRTYLRDHAAELHKHVAATESDNGAMKPFGWHLDQLDADRLKLATVQLRTITDRLGLKINVGSSAPDIGHFKPSGVPCMGLWVDGTRYFDYHHTETDTVDKVDPHELSLCVATTAVTAFLIADMPERLGQEALTAGAIEKVATGYKFTEGPAADREGNVFFTDIPNERIVRFDGKAATVFREKSGKANGLMFDRKGRLWACEGGARRLSRDGETVADSFGGKKLNSPNDLVLDDKGGCYFTDPRYGKRDDLEQDKEAVYYVAPDGKVSRVADTLARPNGVMLSGDAKTLYVADEGAGKIVAFEVKEDGTLGKARDFAAVRADGMTLDERGNLYAAARGGIVVLDKSGGQVTVIPVPENPTNCTFSGTTLYVTAQTSLYRIAMKVRGIR